MHFDTWLIVHDLRNMPQLTRAIEDIGFDGIWSAEANKNGFFPLVLAAEHSERVTLGTSVAPAFPRSPTVLAHIAWDLAEYSNGRFILGIGSQVRAHNERRLGVKWEKPVRKMRETIEAMHAIFDCWQNGTRLKYEGEFFNIDLMTPFFSGQPLQFKRPPVYISAVNPNMLRLVGRVCDGVLVHPVHSVRFLREVALPLISEGLARSGRKRENVTIVNSVFAVPTDGAVAAAEYEARAKSQMAFYMSTPAYRSVLDLHGWSDVGERLGVLARSGEWAKMADEISDEILDTFAITGKWSELPGIVHDRYGGGELSDRVTFYLPYIPGEEDEGWRAAVDGFTILKTVTS